MADQAMTYMAKIGVDGSEFVGGLEKMAQGFTAMFGPTGIAVGAIAITGNAIANLVIEQGKLADANLDMAETTGIAVEEIQRFHFAAKLSGDSISAVDSMLNKLTLSMGEARNATSAQAAAFAEMGINPEGKSTEQVFIAMANSLTNMSDKQKAASLAMDILGKSYKDALPYMADYLKNQNEIAAKEVFTKEQEQQLQKGKEAFDRIGAAAEWAAGQAALLAVNSYDGFDQFVQTAEGGGGAMNMLAASRRASGYQGADRGKGLSDAMEADKAAAISAAAVQKGIIDPYAGWTAAEVEVQTQTDKVTAAQTALNTAMQQINNEENVAKVRALSAEYRAQEQVLRDLLGAVVAVESAKNPYYDPGAIENQGPSTAEERAAAMAGINYGSGANVGYYEGELLENSNRYKSNLAFAQSDTTGNASLKAILAMEKNRFTVIGHENNPNYGYGNGTYSSMSDDYMAAYQKSLNPQVTVLVSPDFSESAQSIAEKTAEAISRELARQATSS